MKGPASGIRPRASPVNYAAPPAVVDDAPPTGGKAPPAAVRFQPLDMLRGIAVLLVIGRHMIPPTADVAPAIRWVAGLWHQVGWSGVDLFFVLSGFLISGLLFNEYQRHGEIHAGRFLVRRGFKIYPAFYALLAASAVVEVWAGGWTPEFRRGLIAEALYLQGYWGRLWNHTWSLAVEEHFYILLTLALWLLVRRRQLEGLEWPITVFVCGMAVLTLALRLAAWPVYQANHDAVYIYATHFRLSSLAWGVLLGYWYHFRREAVVGVVRRYRGAIALASAALLVAPLSQPRLSWFLFGFGYPMLAWGYAGVLLLCVVPPQGGTATAAGWRRRLIGALAIVGFHSYSVYLWHVAVREWLLARAIALPGFADLPASVGYGLAFAGYVAAAVGCGIVAARLIEHPALALRERWFPSRTSGIGAVPGALA